MIVTTMIGFDSEKADETVGETGKKKKNWLKILKQKKKPKKKIGAKKNTWQKTGKKIKLKKN